MALGLLLGLIVTVSGCGQPKALTSINSLTTTAQINQDNSPAHKAQVFLAGTPKIYFSAKVTNAVPGTKVDVQWTYATGNRVIATESFRGGRDKERPQEFMLGLKPATSFIASQITLNQISWPLGTYAVAINLNGQPAGEINFNIVSDKDFDLLSKKGLLKNIYLGSQINKQKQVTIPGTNFTRDQETIYAVALFEDVPANTTIKAVWKYLNGNQEIDSFYAPFSGSGYLPFAIGLENFGRLWADRLWPKGNYEVSLYVDNVPIITKNFTVS